MKVIWTPEAEAERFEIGDCTALDGPRAAARSDALFDPAVLRLADFPRMGRLGVIARTREWVPHSSDVSGYEIREDSIWIVSVHHGARQWRPAATETT